MASPITITGLGSGLDSKAIIDALMKVESIPIQQLEDRKALEQKKLDLLGTFKGLITALHDKAKDLSTLGTFLSYKASSSDSSAVTATASSNAVAGAHSVIIKTLASADRWAFAGVPDPDADLATANGQAVTFSVGANDYTISVAQASSSLNEIASAINTQAGADVSASVVNAGTDSAPSWQLVISAKATGSAGVVTNLASSIAGLTGAVNIVAGSDATATIDGLDVTREDNDFSGVVQGVSITALQADPNTTLTVTVAPDKDAIKQKLKGFVDAYNEIVEFVGKQNTYDKDKGPGGELFGDNILSTMISTVRGALFGQTAADVANDTAGYGTLRLVGIESNRDGTLKINDATLDKKLDADIDSFADLFVDTDGFDNGGATPGTPAYYIDQTADSGMMDDLVRAIDRVVDSYQDQTGHFSKGIFDARTDAINANIKLFDQQIDEKSFRLDQYQEQLTAKFAALEGAMAQLQSQQAYLNNVKF